MFIKRPRDASFSAMSFDEPTPGTIERPNLSTPSALERLPAEVLHMHIVPELQSFQDGSLAAFAAASRITHAATMAGVLRPYLSQLHTGQLYGAFGQKSSLAPPPFGQAHPAALAFIALKRISALLDRHGFATESADISMVPKTRTAAMYLDTLNVAVDMLLEPHPRLPLNFGREVAAAVRGLKSILFEPLTAWAETTELPDDLLEDEEETKIEHLEDYHRNLIELAGTDVSQWENDRRFKHDPPIWLYLANLRELCFEKENFFDDIELPAELAYLPKLSMMSFSGYRVSLPDSMAQMAELRKLCVEHAESLKTPAVISQLTQLTELRLPLGMPPDVLASIDFKGLINLKILELTFATEIPESVFSLTNLEYLDISGAWAVPPSISNLKNLISLELKNCWLIELPKDIAQLSKLKRIDARYSRLLKIFPYFVEQMPQLEALNLEHCSALPDETMPLLVGNLLRTKHA